MNGIKLEYINEKRSNYLSLSDMVQDLTIETLIKLLPTYKEFYNQMIVISEIEKREILEEDKFYTLLETCNGI